MAHGYLTQTRVAARAIAVPATSRLTLAEAVNVLNSARSSGLFEPKSILGGAAIAAAAWEALQFLKNAKDAADGIVSMPGGLAAPVGWELMMSCAGYSNPYRESWSNTYYQTCTDAISGGGSGHPFETGAPVLFTDPPYWKMEVLSVRRNPYGLGGWWGVTGKYIWRKPIAGLPPDVSDWEHNGPELLAPAPPVAVPVDLLEQPRLRRRPWWLARQYSRAAEVQNDLFWPPQVRPVPRPHAVVVDGAGVHSTTRDPLQHHFSRPAKGQKEKKTKAQKALYFALEVALELADLNDYWKAMLGAVDEKCAGGKAKGHLRDQLNFFIEHFDCVDGAQMLENLAIEVAQDLMGLTNAKLEKKYGNRLKLRKGYNSVWFT